MKYLLITRAAIEVVESEPDHVWELIMHLNYPNGFVSLTAMEDPGGPRRTILMADKIFILHKAGHSKPVINHDSYTLKEGPK